MVRVLLDAEGLLQRFGRPDPDAVGLAAALTRLQARVARRPRPRSASAAERDRQLTLGLDVAAVRFAAATTASDDQHIAGLPVVVMPDEAGLGPGDLYFTAAHARLAATRRQGASAYIVGLDPAVGERVVDVWTVPRLVEEALRLPTARPRSAATRRGGLLTVDVGSRARARTETLEVMRADPNADWVVLGTHLLLYTEDPDVEDQLAERPGVDRLSYRVSRDDLLVFLPGAPGDVGAADAGAADAGGGRRAAGAPTPTGDSGVLFARDGVIVREQASGAPRSAGVPSDAPSGATSGTWHAWHEVRRRSFDLAGAEAADDGRRLTATIDDAEIDAFRARVADLTALLRPRLRSPIGEALVSALRELAGPAAVADAWPGDALGSTDDPPRVVAWQTPYADAESDELVIVRHDLSAAAVAPLNARASEVPDSGALVKHVAVALATAELLSQRPWVPGALHTIDLALPAAGVAGGALRAESLFLLAGERNRVHAVVAFPSAADDATALRTVVGQLAAATSSHGDSGGDA